MKNPRPPWACNDTVQQGVVDTKQGKGGGTLFDYGVKETIGSCAKLLHPEEADFERQQHSRASCRLLETGVSRLP